MNVKIKKIVVFVSCGIFGKIKLKCMETTTSEKLIS